MRVAAILGPGFSPRHLRQFEKAAILTWLTKLPTQPEQADAILIFGGDGTIHRYLPQLIELQLPVLIVPCGSGNDFARALGYRRVRDSLAAWQAFLSGRENTRSIDLGVVIPRQKSEAGGATAPPPNYFCTIAGIGLDGEVARRANRLPRWLRAHGGYALTLPPALFGFSAVSVTLAAGDRIRNSRIFLAAFANTPAYGGGMKIAPHARLDDGKLDVCIVGEAHKLKLFCLFPTVYFGRHLPATEVDYFQAQRITAEAETPLDVYADGEFLCHTPIEITVAENALRVIVPPS